LGEQAKENYEKLYVVAHENSMAEVSKDLVWDKMDGRKMSAVMLKSSADFSNKNDWTKQFAWFKENLERFTKYFKPKIANL
jgi:hypothetical protein